MDKKQELIDVITQHPERELVVMYSTEGNSDHAYTLGEILGVDVTEMTDYNDERIFFSDEYDELLEILEEDICDEKYPEQTINDEQVVEIERLAKEEIKKYKWKPVIAVFVG